MNPLITELIHDLEIKLKIAEKDIEWHTKKLEEATAEFRKTESHLLVLREQNANEAR